MAVIQQHRAVLIEAPAVEIAFVVGLQVDNGAAAVFHVQHRDGAIAGIQVDAAHQLAAANPGIGEAVGIGGIVVFIHHVVPFQLHGFRVFGQRQGAVLGHFGLVKLHGFELGIVGAVLFDGLAGGEQEIDAVVTGNRAVEIGITGFAVVQVFAFGVPAAGEQRVIQFVKVQLALGVVPDAVAVVVREDVNAAVIIGYGVQGNFGAAGIVIPENGGVAGRGQGRKRRAEQHCSRKGCGNQLSKQMHDRNPSLMNED